MNITFIKKHMYLSGLLGFVLLSALVVPALMIADVTDRAPSCPINDRDCDGALNIVPPNCPVCSAFDVDMDDNDPSVSSAVGTITGSTAINQGAFN